jgi:hypothetical protein
MRSLLLIAALLSLAAPARAATYEVEGMSAASPGADGWSPVIRAPRGYVGWTAGPGELTVQFHTRAVFDRGDLGEWLFAAPADTAIVAWDVERAVSGIGGGGWNTLFAASGDGHTRFVATEVPSRNRPFALMHADGLSASRVMAILHCAGPVPCRAAPTAILRLRSARLTLSDVYAPAPSEPRGDLAGGGVLTGTAALSFTATDRGGGLYRAYAIVDGRRLPAVPIGDSRCRPLPGTEHRFAYRRPCPLSGGAVVALDTRALADGRHTIAVAVEDAAGNAVTMYGPTTRTVDNLPARPKPPAPVRTPSLAPRYTVTARLERDGRRARALTVPYGTRVRIRGRVAVAGGPDRAVLARPWPEPTAPLVGAVPLAVSERVALPRASWRALTGLRTRVDGRFTAFARIGPSRRLRLAAPGGAAAALTVRVRAPITAHPVRGVLRGRLRGGYVPRGGALVELQVRTRRGWATRRVVRTFSTGRYSGRVGARGTFRARVPRQPGLPFAPGVSPPRRAGRTASRTFR